MTPKQLILHVGFHKSGTSALQESFDGQRSMLASAGVLYPNIDRKAHHRIAWALAQRRWGWKERGGETAPFKHFSKMARKINRSSSEKVLLSSEFFSELTTEQIQKISGAVKGREVKILFTLRPLVKMLSSSYQQYLKYGIKADYSTWLHSIFDEPGVSKITPSFWKRHLHGEVVQRWSEVFGPSAVTVVIADESRPEFLFSEVNQFLGLEPDFLKPQPAGGNRSLSVQEISLLLKLNNIFPKERSWDEYRIFIRNGYIRRLTDSVELSATAGKLPTPAWAIAQANKLSSISKQTIQELGVTVLGNIQNLDAETVPEGEPFYSESIDIETVAQAMLVFDKKLVRRIPGSWTIAEYASRLKKRVLGLFGIGR